GLNWGLLDDPARAGVGRLVRDLNAAYRAHAALWSQDTTPDGFAWIISDDTDQNVFAFARFGSDGTQLVCVVNFSPVLYESYRVGLPMAGRWVELINTDAEAYGG